MRTGYIDEARGMAAWLLANEHKGPGDTIDAAAYRLETRYGVPHSLLLRLRHREIKDMLMSNFAALAHAYQAATQRMEQRLEHEKKLATDPRLLRLAALVAGPKDEPEGKD